jgi:hypothetical protein
MRTKNKPEEMKPLQVQRARKKPPIPRHNDGVNMVALWNAIARPGTWVRFFPTWGRWEESRTETIDRRASVSAAGQPVLWLETSGCVSAYHCEPLTPEDLAQERPWSKPRGERFRSRVT